eukprot:535920_1
MPYDDVTGKLARDDQIEDKQSRQSTIDDKLMDARHMKKLYGCSNFMDLRNELQIQKYDSQNYPSPCKTNLHLSKKIKKKKKRSKTNRGREMVQAALCHN